MRDCQLCAENQQTQDNGNRKQVRKSKYADYEALYLLCKSGSMMSDFYREHHISHPRFKAWMKSKSVKAETAADDRSIRIVKVVPEPRVVMVEVTDAPAQGHGSVMVSHASIKFGCGVTIQRDNVMPSLCVALGVELALHVIKCDKMDCADFDY